MWTSLHHVTTNGRIHVPTKFLRRPRYALLGISSYYGQSRWRPLPCRPSSTSRANEKPYHVPCKNDGWHHVSSTSAKQPDAKEFVQAVIKEVNGHVDSNNWTLWKQSKAPEDVQIVPSVWSLWCKGNLTMNEVKLHKARLNLHGGKQVFGIFWDICPRWDLVCHQANDRLWNHFLLSPLTCGLCYGISTSSNWDGHLHGIATRDSNQAWEFQGSCFEAREYLRPETGLTCVEFIPPGQTRVHRIYNVTNRWLPFLPRCHHIFMVCMDNGIFLGSNDS